MKKAIALLLTSALVLSGCVTHPAIYNPEDFVRPDRIKTNTVYRELPPPAVHATFSLGNNPEVVKAYQTFSKNGQANAIQSKGFVTLPYDGYSHPIIACQPLHLCVVQLEQNETINNIELGDAAHWLVSTALIGTEQRGSYQIAIKPKAYNIATDMVITTNKRTYNIGLVSKQGENTHVTNFYYPEESLQQAVAHTQAFTRQQNQDPVVDTKTKVEMDHLHFNYRVRGDYPAWRPQQVFDDGNKTFIRMPAISAHVDLPVLYLLKQHQQQLVNYRYKRPYYVIDALFKKAVLVSGKGHRQVKVIIDNRNFKVRRPL